jgi:ribose 5-phosphate isomerase B
MTGEVLLRKIVEAWLTTDFQGGRHQRRINKIAAIEKGENPAKISR